MKEFFDQLRAHAQARELPEPAELRARGDRRVARRGAAGAFSLAIVMAGAFIAARPLFHEPPRISAESGGTLSPAPQLQTLAVPDVRHMPRDQAISVLTQQGFKVQVRTASPAASPDPKQGGKVREQDPIAAQRIPSQTTVTIWVDQPEATPVCADKYPEKLLVTLFVKTEAKLCYTPADPADLGESLPVPCWPAALASESAVEDRLGFNGTFTEEIRSSGPAPTMIDQTVTKYRSSGAKDYLSELSRDIGRCQPVVRGGLQLTYSLATLASTEKIGDQSLLINVKYHLLDRPETGLRTSEYLISVVRMGVYVIVVYDKGWEGVPSKRATILATARAMASKIT